MFEWNTSREDLNIIGEIVKRAKKEGVSRDSLSLMMDIELAHEYCPLRLKDFLEFGGFDFKHDVYGIINNLNRCTGVIENCFLPRCAK